MGTDRVVAGRFRLLELAGTGGMGHVWRSTDELTGLPVALKVMSKQGSDPSRFVEEAQLLAQLAHPRIVRHVAHGFAESGEPYLAMEWLEGEDLSMRLARAGLSVRDTLAIARRSAEALAAIHARGVVHRDLKPSNLFLEARDPDRVKLLDFGIARALDRARVLTKTNATVGTAGYVAPEQAKGGRTVDARADVFSLGCVLFECLTGQPAFAGEHAVAVLAKVLMEDAPRPSSLRDGVPAALDALLARMLAKSPEDRPADGAALLAEIDALGEVDLAASAPPPRPKRALSDSEQRLLSVLLVDTARTQVDGTLTESADEQQLAPMGNVVRRFGGTVAYLAGGLGLVRLEGPGGAADRAARAAHCALALAGALPDATIALATGSAEATDTFPVGPVIDRAVELLRSAPGAGVRIDDSTEALLGGRFEVLREDGALWLAGRRDTEEGARLLLGRPTPCVGRDREIAMLEATFRECVETPLARAVLVTAPAGTGKSRLRHEIVARLRAEGTPRVLFARAESVAAGSSFALARELVRSAVSLRDGDPPAQQHAQIREHLRLAPPESRERLAEILGELAGAPTTGEPSPALRAARADARVLGDAVQRALVEWLDAECSAQPVVIVLEDLHWGDLFTTLSVGDALRKLRDRPLFVLALARPDLHDTFPALWASAGAQEIRLGGLTRRASEALARAVLGDTAAPAVIARIVALADGNAFYLEELIRRVAEGGGDALPDTVLAMAQSRLAQLDPDSRRVLRAASVYGERFRPASVQALLADETVEAVEQILHSLSRAELIERGGQPGELVFRHALLRDASYAMLTEADRRTGHRLAADQLIGSGERDPLLLASHLERSDDPSRAAPWLAAAAESAFAGTDMRGTLDLAERASALGAEGPTLGAVRALEAIACTGLSEQQERGHAAATSALALVPPGSDPWFLAAASQVLLAAYSGRADAVMDVLMKVMQLPIESTPPSRSQGLAMLMLCSACYTAGQPAIARMLIARARGVAQAHPEELLYRGWLGNAESTVVYEGELGTAWRGAELARQDLASATDVLGHAFGIMLRGVVEIECGAWEQARCTLEDAMKVTSSSSAMFVREWNHVYLGRALGLLGRRDEAESALEPVRGVRELNKKLRAALFAAESRLVAGDPEGADHEVVALSGLAATMPGIQVQIASVRARAAIARSAWSDAVAIAGEAIPLAERIQPYPLDVSFLHAARVEGLGRLGDPRADEARAAAQARIVRIAATLDGLDGLRAAYLAIAPHQLTG